MGSVPVDFQAIVSSAERIGIGHIGFAAIHPGNPVIDIAGEHIATGPDASAPTKKSRCPCPAGEQT